MAATALSREGTISDEHVEIVPDDAGRVLTLTEAGIDLAAEPGLVPPGVAEGTGQGRRQMMDLLATTLRRRAA